MAIVKPFTAVRPTRDKVALVTTRSYEVYPKKELKTLLKLNPFSFLHILKPGYKFKKDVVGKERFNLVRNRYLEFVENNIFKRENKPKFYLHQKVYENKCFWGIIALASIDDYENNVIKKHENTLKSREELFGQYLLETGFNAEPVLITYPDNTYLSSIYQKYKNQRAEYEFTTNKKRTHHFWLIEDVKEIENIEKEFGKMEAIYIADGHHRTASSYYVAKKLERTKPIKSTDQKSNYFMAYFTPESSLQVTSFYRFVKTLNGLTSNEFLIALDKNFRIENNGEKYYKPSKPHHFSMYLDGEFYKLYLRKAKYRPSNVVDKLDAKVLHKTILEPILGIKDLTNSEQIAYQPEIKNPLGIKNEVDSGKFAVAFGTFPIDIQQIKEVADSNLVMPPKSTYVEPKLRSGLTIYEFK